MRITLTNEQLKIVDAACSPVEVCDAQGNVLGTINPYAPGFVCDFFECADAPRYSNEQVRNHLRALQEAWDREGPFDQARMREILAEIRERDK